jgi:hypothetical protein
MHPKYRQSLLAVVARLDQLSTVAEGILVESGDAEHGAMAEKLRELIVEMQAKIEEKLDALA